MFLLSKDDVTKEDRTVTVNYPFMITLPGRLYAFAAFPTTELAEYFKRLLKLGDEYKSVDLGIIEKRKLKESRHLYVFSARADINRLFSKNKRSRSRALRRNRGLASQIVVYWMLQPGNSGPRRNRFSEPSLSVNGTCRRRRGETPVLLRNAASRRPSGD